jgi:hypothetical protein
MLGFMSAARSLSKLCSALGSGEGAMGGAEGIVGVGVEDIKALLADEGLLKSRGEGSLRGLYSKFL